MSREEILDAALRANLSLVREAQAIIIRYLDPEDPSSPRDAMQEMIRLFDGPQQKEALRLAKEALKEP